MFMPMTPEAPERTAPMRNPQAVGQPRAVANRQGDFAHALVAVRQAQDSGALPDAVSDRDKRAYERKNEASGHFFFSLKRSRILSGRRRTKPAQTQLRAAKALEVTSS